MFEEAKERILAHIGPSLGELDLDIFDFGIKRHGRTIAVQLFIDHADGGVNIDECSAVNKEISRLIEDEQLLEGEYTVEVSSPGLDRPLKTDKDFIWAKGKLVKFHLKDKVAEKKEHDGLVKEVEGENVVVDIKGSMIQIPLTLIQKAVQIIN